VRVALVRPKRASPQGPSERLHIVRFQRAVVFSFRLILS
jgi:hypothetical protein